MQTETSKSSARAEEPQKVVHNHPRGMRDRIAGLDPDGRRIVVTEMDRQPTYLPNCKACQAADRERMAGPAPKYNLETTMFLLPEPEYDNMVCRAYLIARYPDAEHIVHAFNADKLSYVKGAQVVVITRRGKNGKLGPRTKRAKDEEGTFYDAPIPPETYLDEVVESDPIVVADCVRVQAGSMYAEESVDFSELMARIAERAVPFRIAPPIAPDKLYVMRLNS